MYARPGSQNGEGCHFNLMLQPLLLFLSKSGLVLRSVRTRLPASSTTGQAKQPPLGVPAYHPLAISRKGFPGVRLPGKSISSALGVGQPLNVRRVAGLASFKAVAHALLPYTGAAVLRGRSAGHFQQLPPLNMSGQIS